MKAWFQLAYEWAVVRRALICTLIVGAVLTVINHGDALLSGEMTPARLVRIGLTFLVPYCVSTYSSVAAMRATGRKESGSA